VRSIWRAARHREDVDLTVAGTIGDYVVSEMALMSRAERNGLMARLVASVTGEPEEKVAGTLGAMFGTTITLRQGVTNSLQKRWRSTKSRTRSDLRRMLKAELASAGAELDAAYGLGAEAMARALATIETRSLGNRTIGAAIELAPEGGLAPLAPLAPIGPIRLWADLVASESDGAQVRSVIGAVVAREKAASRGKRRARSQARSASHPKGAVELEEDAFAELARIDLEALAARGHDPD
jgi:hypothetical protein